MSTHATPDERATPAALANPTAPVGVTRSRREGPGPRPITGPLPTGAPVLVVGATGMMGSQVVRALLDRGATVQALVRDPARATLPDGVEVVRGDLREPAGVRAALQGAGAAFYISPHETDERALAAGFLAACEEAGVRLVFAGVHASGRNWLEATVVRLATNLLLPTYRGKLALARAIARSPLRPVVLIPTNFMQADEVFGEELRAGQFVLPISAKGVNRVDLRDLGEVAARALVVGDIAGGSYPVVGPRSLSGSECAAVWTAALGRPVTYTGDDDERMVEAFERRLSGRRRVDWTTSFRKLRTLGVPTSARDLRTTRHLLGREPRDYETYVGDAAASLREQALLVADPGGTAAQKPSAAR